MVLKRNNALYIYKASDYSLERSYSGFGANSLCANMNKAMSRLIIGTNDEKILRVYPSDLNIEITELANNSDKNYGGC